MPNVDGMQVLNYVRSNEALRNLPVIMMSASEETERVCECIRGGAEEYLLKPVTKKEVQNIWQHVLKKLSQALPPPQQAAALQVTCGYCHTPCIDQLAT